MSEPEDRDGGAILIPIENRKRIGVEVPREVLARIDAFPERHGLDRARFVLRAAEHELEQG